MDRQVIRTAKEHFDVMSFDEYQSLFSWLLSSYDVGLDQDFKYSFAVTLKETGQLIGWCGVGGLEFNSTDKEIYYLIGKQFWNKGYGYEAASALVDHCFRQYDLTRLVAKVDARNIGSKKIIEKLGFHFEHVISGLPEQFSQCNGEYYYSLTRNGRQF